MTMQITFDLPPGVRKYTYDPPPAATRPGPTWPPQENNDEIHAWVQVEQRDYLQNIMGIIDDLPLDAAAAAIRTACQRGFGIWMEPPSGRASSPATHLIEIALFGVTGSGLTLEEATSSWRTAARRTLQTEPTA